MSFISRLLGLDTQRVLLDIGRGYQKVVAEQQAEIEQLKLEHVRAIRDLVEQFWIVQEAGTDVRETLWEGLNDLRDHVARLEEHTPTLKGS